jgi:hypothetical protein
MSWCSALLSTRRSALGLLSLGQMRRGRIFVVSLLAAAAWACESLSGLTSGSNSDGGAEAGAADAQPPKDAPAPDTQAPTDSAAPNDTGTTNVDASDAGAMPFCASQSPAPLFCDDFDTDASLGVTWTVTSSPPTTVAAKTSTFWRSPPFAFASSLAGGPASAGLSATLDKMISLPSVKFRVAFDMRTGGPDCQAGGVWTLSLVRLSNLGAAHQVLLTYFLGGPYAVVDYLQGGGDGGADYLNTIPIGPFTATDPDGWFRLTFDVQSSPPQLDVHFDQTAVLTAMPLAQAPWVKVDLNIGANAYTGQPPSCEVDYDNVVIETE